MKIETEVLECQSEYTYTYVHPDGWEHPNMPRTEVLDWIEKFENAVAKDMVVMIEGGASSQLVGIYWLSPHPFTILNPRGIKDITIGLPTEAVEMWERYEGCRYGHEHMPAVEGVMMYSNQEPPFKLFDDSKPFTVIGFWTDEEVSGWMGYEKGSDTLVVLFA